ncbi:uncharacterized protein LOC113471333 [Diaphorina citri]|uniref:Uncharacterized protein LOC113471333 n=1 Tax=Diaphorina citri TaxID=121845 RepID=A0A3Q0JCH7_DIACI|nr:uncharacterized protein LOC113471333 [Diaphorina citri]
MMKEENEQHKARIEQLTLHMRQLHDHNIVLKSQINSNGMAGQTVTSSNMCPDNRDVMIKSLVSFIIFNIQRKHIQEIIKESIHMYTSSSVNCRPHSVSFAQAKTKVRMNTIHGGTPVPSEKPKSSDFHPIP